MTERLVTDPTTAERDALAAMYADSEHWGHRSATRYREALEASDLVIGLFDDGRPVAGARVLTDHTFYARLFDVHVVAERRREGLGSRLVEGVLAHPALESVDAVSLGCRAGLRPFYEAAGFEQIETVENDGESEAYCSMMTSEAWPSDSD